MSKHTHPFIRQLCIISSVRNQRYITKQELIFKLENRFMIAGDEARISIPTIDRDIKAIREDFGLELNYSHTHKGYYIETSNYQDHIIANTVEAFEVFATLNLPTGFPEFIIPEKRKPNGIDLFIPLTKYILEKKCISFAYFKFDTQTTTNPKIEPLALKESKQRWYLIGKPINEQSLRAYALDRITDIQNAGGKVRSKIKATEIEAIFQHSFAMFTSNKTPEKVQFKVDKRDGNYIKTFPLHSSQEIQEDADSFTVSLCLHITEDFLMELMSRAWSIEVLQPLSLRKILYTHFENAMKRNLVN
jgi:proteasome accessory factor B